MNTAKVYCMSVCIRESNKAKNLGLKLAVKMKMKMPLR